MTDMPSHEPARPNGASQPTTTTDHPPPGQRVPPPNPTDRINEQDRRWESDWQVRRRAGRAMESGGLNSMGRLDAPAFVLLAIAAVLGNLALFTELAGLVAPLAAVAAAAFLWRAGSLTSVGSRSAAVAAVVISLWLPIRASGWLVGLNSLTVAVLLTGAVVFDRHPTPRLSFRSLSRLAGRCVTGLAAPLLIARSAVSVAGHLRGGSRIPTAAVIRGLLLAALPVLILGSFLMEADAVFASWIEFDVPLSDMLIGHTFLTVFVALCLAGLVCVGRAGTADDSGRPALLGGIELVIVLGSVFVLFGTFAFSQLLGATDAADRALEAQRLTYAEYARSGFFQLLAVAALTLLLLSALRALARPATGHLDVIRRALGAGVCLLTVLIVVVSIVRLGLYVDAFGQTTLRWYSTAFAWLLGAIFVVFAAEHAFGDVLHRTVGGPKNWFGAASLVMVLATLFTVNVVNPELRVARHNLTQTATEAELDVDYLVRLSADAWPVVLEYQDEIDGRLPDPWRYRHGCTSAERHLGYGIAGFSLPRHRLTCPPK